jgi:hypothetical protein
MTAKYFKYAFALAGDKSTVPEPTQVDGSVSYQEGFPFDYQRPKTDPQSKNIPRDQTNQLFFDLSAALKQYQENAFPDWITNADNLGVDYPYRVGDYVRYTDGIVYRSLVNANTAVPGTDLAKWKPFLFTSSDLGTGFMLSPSGNIIQWGQGMTTTGHSGHRHVPARVPRGRVCRDSNRGRRERVGEPARANRVRHGTHRGCVVLDFRRADFHRGRSVIPSRPAIRMGRRRPLKGINMYYAASTGGFYNKSIHGDNMPADAVELSPERYAELLDGQRQGRIIAPHVDGTPTLRDYVEGADTARARALESVRQARPALFAVLDGRQSSALVAKDTAKGKAIEEAKQALRDVTSMTVFNAGGTYDQIMTAADAELSRIAALVP